MKFNLKHKGFTVYNNRSLEVVKMFVNWNTIDIPFLNDIEAKMEEIQNEYQPERFVELDDSELNLSCNDIIYGKKSLSKQTSKFLSTEISPDAYSWLLKRGITWEIIEKYKLNSSSNFEDDSNFLDVIGYTVHPLLNKILDYDQESILIPLFEKGKLVNCAVRRIGEQGKIKYSLACPDVSVWGLEEMSKGDDVWTTEGIFDMMALNEVGPKALSVSSAMWSGLQLYFLLKKEPNSVTIFSDNDCTGLRCSKILQEFFSLYGLNSKTFISNSCKDPSEHFFEKDLSWRDVKEVNITKKMIIDNRDNSFDFLQYMKNRKL